MKKMTVIKDGAILSNGVIIKTPAVKAPPVSRAGVVLFIFTMLFIAGLIALFTLFVFSFGDIVNAVTSMFGNLPIFGGNAGV